MTNQSLEEGDILGTLRRPAGGWDQTAGSALNDLVRRLAGEVGWRHLVVMMHPSAWSQLVRHLNYNVGIPRPGIPMGGPYDDDPEKVAVVYRAGNR